MKMKRAVLLWAAVCGGGAAYVTYQHGVLAGLATVVLAGVVTWLGSLPACNDEQLVPLSRPYVCEDCGARKTSVSTTGYALLQSTGDVMCPDCRTRMAPQPVEGDR